MEKRLYIHGEGHDIPIVLSYPDEGEGPFPAMLLLHGYMAWKEGDGYMLGIAAKRFADAGIASARIDFCSMGENRCSREKYGLEIMLKEAETAFHYLCDDPNVDANRVGIAGHSLGGRVTFLSSNLPSKCLVSLNGAINVDDPTFGVRDAKDNELMEKQGYLITHTSDGRTELLFPKFIEDCKKCVSSDIYNYKNPICVCVGKNDPTLDPNVSYNWVKNCGMDNVSLIEIDDANHTFNAKTGDYTKLNELYDKLIVWLNENLKK